MGKKFLKNLTSTTGVVMFIFGMIVLGYVSYGMFSDVQINENSLFPDVNEQVRLNIEKRNELRKISKIGKIPTFSIPENLHIKEIFADRFNNYITLSDQADNCEIVYVSDHHPISSFAALFKFAKDINGCEKTFEEFPNAIYRRD